MQATPENKTDEKKGHIQEYQSMKTNTQKKQMASNKPQSNSSVNTLLEPNSKQTIARNADRKTTSKKESAAISRRADSVDLRRGLGSRFSEDGVGELCQSDFIRRLMVLRDRERVLPYEEEWRVFRGVRESKVEVKYLDARNPHVLQQV